jgi:preprotein translocase subunit SecA
MLNVFGKLFDSNEKEINKLQPLIEKINNLDKEFKKLKDSDFPKKTKEFKERVEDGEPLESILPEAFAWESDFPRNKSCW